VIPNHIEYDLKSLITWPDVILFTDNCLQRENISNVVSQWRTLVIRPTIMTTVISNSSANHLLYADDTQLLLSFSALDFS